ncbi:MAG: hypothetical protein WC340_13000, partial [Kiritimatiellia bacterium]
RGRGRNRNRYRKAHKIDTDSDTDPDSDSDAADRRVTPSFFRGAPRGGLAYNSAILSQFRACNSGSGSESESVSKGARK